METQKPSPQHADDGTLNKNEQTPALEKPQEAPPEKELRGFAQQGLLEPTRFGDWEVKGRCSDF